MSSTLDMIKVMQAYTEGKVIEVKRVRDLPPGASPEWTSAPFCPTWNWAIFDYRIAPEPPKPKYRPYNDNELIGLVGNRLKYKQTGDVLLVLGALQTDVAIRLSFVAAPNQDGESLFNNFTHLNGSPCGVKL